MSGEILRSVSRSFFLSVRLLPRRLRQPVGLAYLLARATDTIADTFEVPVGQRREQLKKLAVAIQAGAPDPSLAADLKGSFVPLQPNDSERRLMLVLPDCLAWLRSIDPKDGADIKTVLARINQAQMMDLDRFENPQELRALANPRELVEYAYLIAGCVGEFWTAVCARHLPDFAERSREDMDALGRQYGEGLQLVNILRDAHGDLRAGRCYFPADELAAAGLKPSEIFEHPLVFKPIFETWLARAESGLKAGIEYADAIRDRRVRAATALPALIGARTITLLRSAGVKALAHKVKVPRGEVRGMLGSVAITLASRRTMRNIFERNLRP